jgi:two-component system chemotaxis response regulator CheB
MVVEVRRTINEERVPRDVIRIGASAGGVEALIGLVENLPADLPAAIAVVLHRNPLRPSRLLEILTRRSALAVREPLHVEPLEQGTIYLAPRDSHMVLQEDHSIGAAQTPTQHRVRPAIDPLFRSAAALYGRRVVGVILSGLGADGVSGLIAIKAGGGLSLVQHPGEAAFPALIQRAIRQDHVDAVLVLDCLADVLTSLAAGKAVELPPTV